MSDPSVQPGLHTPVGDLDPIKELRIISGLIPLETGIRFLTTVCRVGRKTVERICDVNEEAAFESLDEHFRKLGANEQVRFLKSYAPKMKAKTQAELQACDFQPDEFLLNQCIYDIIDAIPTSRNEFLSRIGVTTPWTPLRDRWLTRRDIENVLKYWWTNQANEDTDKLPQLITAAKSFDGVTTP